MSRHLSIICALINESRFSKIKLSRKPSNNFHRLFATEFYLLLAFILLFTASAGASEPLNDRQFSAAGRGGAVSCGHPLAAAAAIKILQTGGNAVDAAVAAGFMLGVVDFSNSGIGGDGFALICTPAGRVSAFDGSTRWPGHKKQTSPASFIGLPTVPEMLLKMLRLYGRKSTQEVMAPAVYACIKGFRATAYLEKVVEKKLLNTSDPMTISFLAPDGYPLRSGQLFYQPRLARTLMRMAADNGESFYRGNDALQTIADMQKRGSSYQLQDFARYRSRMVMPLRYDYGEFSIYGCPPPSCSLVTIKLALQLLASDNSLLAGSGSELMAIARLGQKFISTKYDSLAACLKTPEKFDEFVKKYQPPTSETGSKVADSNTTHLCVLDKNGMAVSITLTLGNHFGTGELAPGGFFYNNGLRNYTGQVASYPADYPDDAGPVSSKSPVIVTRNGRLWLAIGGAGADRIIFNTALALARLLKGHTPATCVAAPRFYLDYKDLLTLEWQPETGLTNEARKLVEKSEIKAGCDDFFGLVSIIRNENGSLTTAADQRRDGSCAVLP